MDSGFGDSFADLANDLAQESEAAGSWAQASSGNWGVADAGNYGIDAWNNADVAGSAQNFAAGDEPAYDGAGNAPLADEPAYDGAGNAPDYAMVDEPVYEAAGDEPVYDGNMVASNNADAARREEEAAILAGLNAPQREAVMCTEGPLLVLAGAGSGKTTVLTKRIAWILHNHLASSRQILGVTFTNKAANELSERLRKMCGVNHFANVGTFHSVCSRWLRQEADSLGISRNFTIFDGNAQKTLMKHVLKEMDLDVKKFPPKKVLSAVSRYKNDGAAPSNMPRSADPIERRIRDIYELYNQKLHANDALDFDDIMVYTVKLFRDFPDICATYQQRLKYIVVDEYQDVNPVQYDLLRLLSAGNRNICAVGDDDQSIYKFRGADLRIILRFEEDFPDAKTIKLEQNYRSTQGILDAANKVISHNKGRKGKQLWSENHGEGKPIVYGAKDENREAEFVALQLEKLFSEGFKPSDCAVLYRINAMSRLFEETFIHHAIPAKLVGGQRFYERKEIVDLLVYLRVFNNLHDSVSLERLLGQQDGIGTTTMQKLSEWGVQQNQSLYQSLVQGEVLGLRKGQIEKLMVLHDWLGNVCQKAHQRASVMSLLKEAMEYSDFINLLRKNSENDAEFEGRKENVDELVVKVQGFDAAYKGAEAPLEAFLAEVSLYTEQDGVDSDQDMVTLMTIHTSKGLEYPVVFLVGMEENTLPSYQSLQTGMDADVEEERRLCYVGMTRAKRRLFLTFSASRSREGFSQEMVISRFLMEASREFLQLQGKIADAWLGDHPEGYAEQMLGLAPAEMREGSRRPKPKSMYETEKGLRFAIERRKTIAGDGEEELARPAYAPPDRTQRLAARQSRYKKIADDFPVGSKVVHKLNGIGVVLAVDRDIVAVDFGNHQERHYSADFLEPYREEAPVAAAVTPNSDAREVHVGDWLNIPYLGRGIIQEDLGEFCLVDVGGVKRRMKRTMLRALKK